MSETHVTIERACSISGFTPQHIERLCGRGILTCTDNAGVRMIEVAALERYAAERKAQRKSSTQNAEDSEETIMIGGIKYVSTNRAARLSGYNVSQIEELVQNNSIAKKYFGERLFVGLESLFSYRRTAHIQQTVAPTIQEKNDIPEKITRPLTKEVMSLVPLIPVPVVAPEIPVNQVPSAPEIAPLQRREKTPEVYIPARYEEDPEKNFLPDIPEKITIHREQNPSPALYSEKERLEYIQRRDRTAHRAITKNSTYMQQPGIPQSSRGVLKILSYSLIGVAALLGIIFMYLSSFYTPRMVEESPVFGPLLRASTSTIQYYSK
ncbi:MAG: hypothetical protein WAX38_01875 [Minisyncoccia bacterium]